MGMGCPLRFSRNIENGLKEVRMFMPPALVERRRDALYGARRLCQERGLAIPDREIEAALIEGMWGQVLEPMNVTRSIGRQDHRGVPITIYNDTLWDLNKFMGSVKLRGQSAGVRAFYALLER